MSCPGFGRIGESERKREARSRNRQRSLKKELKAKREAERNRAKAAVKFVLPKIPARPPAPAPEAPRPWQTVSRAQLDAALATLPAPTRTLVERQALEGTSYATLAAETGLPPRTIGTRLHRARGRLREALSAPAQP